jgi:lauroyl/myristoyl acyltransferase
LAQNLKNPINLNGFGELACNIFFNWGLFKRGGVLVKINLSSFLQWKINIFVCHQLGWRTAHLYITFLHALYYFFKRGEKRLIEQAVESVFGHQKSDAEIKSLKRRVFRGIRSHYYEKLFNAFSSAETLKHFLAKQMDSQGMGAIEEGLSKNRGVLLVTGHFGAVEFIPGYLAASNYPVTILARFSSSRLRDISMEKAEKFGANIIDVDHTPNILKAILDNLKANRIVITQCDEIDEWKPSTHQIHSFLGKPVNLDRTMNILMKRAQASIVFGLMHRESESRYKLVLTPWEEMEKRILYRPRISVGVAALKLLELYIYKYPEEWYQWKKYAVVRTSPLHGSTRDALTSPQPLKPSLGRAS